MPSIESQLDTLGLSAADLKSITNWPDALIEDYLGIIRNILTIARGSDITIAEVEALVSQFEAVVNSLGALAFRDTVTNSFWSGAPLSVDNGGTDAQTPFDARTNLGLRIGVDVMPWNENIFFFSSALPEDPAEEDTFLYGIEDGEFAKTGLTAFARSYLDDADALEFSQTVGLEIGVDVQAWSSLLDDIAGLTPSDGNFIVGSGSTWTAESGDTAITSLGINATGAELSFVSGVTSSIQDQIDNKQDESPNLTDISGLTPNNNTLIAGDGTNFISIGTGSIIEGSNVSISGTLTNRLFGSGDITINATAGGGQVDSVVAGTGISVDNTDPENPVVSLDAGTIPTQPQVMARVSLRT